MFRADNAAVRVPADGAGVKPTVWTIPADCERFKIQCRTAVDMRISYHQDGAVSGEGQYYTVKSGSVHDEGELPWPHSEQQLFIGAASAVVAEISFWRRLPPDEFDGS